MPRKPIVDGGKRDQIAEAALELFLQNGYDGTSVRSIMKQAGGEAGLFYYYFDSKDAVFELAIRRFVESYRPGFDSAFAEGQREPRKALSIFFEFLRSATEEFREQYADKLHWTMHHAIREQALELMERYLEKIIGLLVESGMPEPPVERRVLCVILASGVGSVILCADSGALTAALPEMRRAVHLLLGSPEGGPVL